VLELLARQRENVAEICIADIAVSNTIRKASLLIEKLIALYLPIFENGERN
jgi:hypothetical protein